MANNPYFSTATVVAGMSAIVALLNTGFLEIYAGTQPTDANTATSGQLLLSSGMTFAATAFATPVASGAAGSRVVTATANTIVSDTSAAATGTAAWFRAYKADGVTGVMSGSSDLLSLIPGGRGRSMLTRPPLRELPADSFTVGTNLIAALGTSTTLSRLFTVITAVAVIPGRSA